MRGSVTAAAVTLLMWSAAAPAAEDPGHRFAPSMAQVFVAEIQRQLSDRGYFAGPASGQVTPQTRTAIAAFEKDVGLPADGVADMAVINMLNFGPRVYAGPGPAPAVTASAAPVVPVAPPAPPPASLAPVLAPPVLAPPVVAPPAAASPPAAAAPAQATPAPDVKAPDEKAADDSPPPLAAPRPEVSAGPLSPPPAAQATTPPSGGGRGPLLPIGHRGARPHAVLV